MGFKYRLPPGGHSEITDCDTCEYRWQCYTEKLGFCMKDDIWLRDEGRGKTYCVLNGVPAHKWRTYEFLLDGKRRKLTERETEVAFTYAGRRLADGGYCDWDDFKRNE